MATMANGRVSPDRFYKVLRSYLANLMKLSQLFMEMWSSETIHCLNFKTEHRKCHDVTNDVKVNFLICGLARCMKNMLVLSNILFLCRALGKAELPVLVHTFFPWDA